MWFQGPGLFFEIEFLEEGGGGIRISWLLRLRDSMAAEGGLWGENWPRAWGFLFMMMRI